MSLGYESRFFPCCRFGNLGHQEKPLSQPKRISEGIYEKLSDSCIFSKQLGS